jgi:hypothetical protein
LRVNLGLPTAGVSWVLHLQSQKQEVILH